jgi:protein-tyrosine phosphatase
VAAAATSAAPKLRINFVCYGNICRSPTSHGVFLAKLEREGLSGEVEVVSCGTYGHRSWPPDERTQRVAAAAGYDLSRLRSRCITAEDYEKSDLLLAHDSDHVDTMLSGGRSQGPVANKVKLLYQYGTGTATNNPKDLDIPDPYYGDEDDFKMVLRMIESSTDNLLIAVKEALASADPRKAIQSSRPPPPR